MAKLRIFPNSDDDPILVTCLGVRPRLMYPFLGLAFFDGFVSPFYVKTPNDGFDNPFRNKILITDFLSPFL